MEERNNQRITVAVVAAIVALLLGLCAGAALGGAVGYMLGQRAAARVQMPNDEFHQFPGSPFELTPPAGAAPLPPAANINGVTVQSVIAGTPAEQAGIRAGDVLTRVEDVTIDAEHALADVLAQYRPGDRVRITLLRGSGERTVDVRLGASPSDAQRPYLGIRYATNVPLQPATPQP